MSFLLPFYKSILEEVHDPATSDLLVLARGLGLRRIVCTLLQIYNSPRNLVLLLNASPEEEAAIGEELSIMGVRNPGLRVVGYETGAKDRQNLYKKGGLISVTSRILVVDMLQADIPTELITGILIMHAEKVTPLVLEAFIVRLYREKNTKGFLKAFTDQPEHITSGLSPLKNIMKELKLRRVHIYPRFQEDIKKSLERRRADVIELSQEMTEPMAEIHHAIIQCMTITLAELKRSNATLDLDDFTVENAYFRSFDLIVRRQLDPVWHKVGPKTKQLVNDLGTLRRLLNYLITYDALSFNAYLETLIAANSTSITGTSGASSAGGREREGPKVHHSPWLLTDAANIIFQTAKRRCYITTSSSKEKTIPKEREVIDLVDDDEWAALDEVHGFVGTPVGDSRKGKAKEEGRTGSERPSWLPDGMEPVLEELPKWDLLADVLTEAEVEMMRLQASRKPGAQVPGTDTILIMCTTSRQCSLISSFLSSIDHSAPKGAKGRKMMMERLRVYLWWKSQLAAGEKNGQGHTSGGMPDQMPQYAYGRFAGGGGGKEDEGISEALKKKDREREEKRMSRRRVRGGAPPSATPTPRAAKEPGDTVMDAIRLEADGVADFWASHGILDISSNSSAGNADIEMEMTLLDDSEFDAFYGLIPAEMTVLVRAYSDDTDDRLLADVQPRFIVMFEPCMEFVRRIEVYRSSSPGLGVRVYHMVYGNSCEEHKYLAGIRREKEAFERMIKERGSMLLPLLEEHRPGERTGDELVKTISSRIAGGRRELDKEPSKVIVDMREFRSTLPSLLHASSLLVIPATLTVGDYILTPEICVERKSLSDLVSSFNSGRLYTQCELMSAYYKHPVLLIEFEEDKAFSLDVVSDLKQYAKPTNKYAPKKKGTGSEATYAPAIQSKIVLLTLTFPRLRIIWSSSPFATAEIFKDLKLNNAEPDPTKAITMGSDDDPDVGAGINTAAEELLRCLPGITGKNVKYVMSKIRNVRELCEKDMKEVQDILGTEPGKACWEFIHRGDRK